MADWGIAVQDLKRVEQALGSGEPVRIQLRNENWEWIYVEALVSSEPFEGAVEAEVVTEGGPFSELEKPVYVKVLRELDSEGVIAKLDITRLTTE